MEGAFQNQCSAKLDYSLLSELIGATSIQAYVQIGIEAASINSDWIGGRNKILKTSIVDVFLIVKDRPSPTFFFAGS